MKKVNIANLIDELKNKLDHKLNETQVIEIRNTFIKKYLNKIYDELRLAPVNEKKELGNTANLLKKAIFDLTDSLLEKIRLAQENKMNVVNYDISISPANFAPGSLTLFSLLIQDAMEYFKSLNFQIVEGSEIVETKYNFDHLNININHPARTYRDSYFINSLSMLRTHCTSVTAKQVENNPSNDIRIVTFGNVYRNDEDDATHSHQFNQIDLVWIKDGLSLRNLKWLINGLLKHLFGEHIQTRYRLSYFPFTEPSFEVDISCINCHGKGCPICKHTGWVEVLGAGMLHSNVLKMSNINIKTGIAAGVGIDRLVMLKYGFKDIRDLYSNDFRILNQFRNIK